MIEKMDNIEALQVLESLKSTHIVSVSNYLPPDTIKLHVMPYSLPYYNFIVDVETTQVPPCGLLLIPLTGPMDKRDDTILLATMPIPGRGPARQNIWLFQDKYSNDNAVMYNIGDAYNYNNRQPVHGDSKGGGQRHMIVTPDPKVKENIILTMYRAL
ncbi:hypothetical protein [Photorhabdus sp. RM323S]|uniref:hypothetical protein n=1 Tax=Photorhabdus sp. RM323S TaxID=3342828 RepID=UPI0036DD1A5C